MLFNCKYNEQQVHSEGNVEVHNNFDRETYSEHTEITGVNERWMSYGSESCPMILIVTRGTEPAGSSNNYYITDEKVQ